MLIAVALLAIGIFCAIVIHRLKVDLEQEKSFRAQLTGGVRLDDHSALLS
jgi:uncharacterized protein YoxC